MPRFDAVTAMAPHFVRFVPGNEMTNHRRRKVITIGGGAQLLNACTLYISGAWALAQISRVIVLTDIKSHNVDK